MRVGEADHPLRSNWLAANVIAALRPVRLLLRSADPVILLAVFVAGWSLFAAISQSSGPIHHDMSEAYVWGREFQLGYYKHPPFWAWVAGGWFLFMPRSGWAFAVLSVVNSAIGLWGSWRLIGRFVEGDRRRAATFLLLLTPFYIFLSLKFNANSIFLSLWPWTAYFFMRSIDDCRVPAAAAFGALMAIDMLSKYIAVLLGVTCLVAASVHPGRRRYFGSAAPYVSVAVGAMLFAPHLWWLVKTDFLPFEYFEQKTGQSIAWSSWLSIRLLVGCLLFHVPIMAVLVASGARSPRAWPRLLREKYRDRRFRTLAVLALSPVILTAVTGMVLGIEVDSNMTVGMFPLLPLFLIEVVRTNDRRLLDTTAPVVAALLVGSLLASPIVAFAKVRYGDIASRPHLELAKQATQIWRERTSSELAFVAGKNARAVAFYSEDTPGEFIGFDFRLAPWVTPDALSRKGLLAVCKEDEPGCLVLAAKFETAESSTARVTVAHTFLGYRAAAETFVLVIVPPRHSEMPAANTDSD